MTTSAPLVCDTAQMAAPNAQDLLVLRAVAQNGRFTTAVDTLGLNHTTVSRRIAALEKALGGRSWAGPLPPNSPTTDICHLTRTADRADG
jgi:hypothetical protein